MIKNYFKTAWRNLWNNRFYTTINLMGLAIGLAVGLIILLWVKDELSYDQYNTQAGQIYRTIANVGDGGTKHAWANTPAPIAVYSQSDIPEVKAAVRIVDNRDFTVYKYQGKEFKENAAAYVDPNFFTIFTIPVVAGNKGYPFPDNNSIVITATTAQKYFGKDNPIGKIIRVDDKENFTVRSVIADFPENSSLKYDILFPADILVKNYTPNEYWKSMNADWGNYYCNTFLLLQEGASIAAVEKKLTQLQQANNKFDQTSFYTLQPLSQLHLYAPDGSSSAKQTVNIFFVVAVLLLLIACINYVNLSTARAMLRAKEVSVRKIIGAGKTQLFLQFITETVLLFALATTIAIGIIYAVMPFYNELSGKDTSFHISDAGVWTTISITIIGTLIAASIYPALLLSSFRPIQALKGKISAGIGNTRFRQVLVVTQFSFSVILIIGTLIIGRQMSYIQSKQLGYDRSHTFVFNMREMNAHYEAIRADLLKQPGITAVTASNGSIVNFGNSTGDTDWEGKTPNTSFIIHPMAIDEHFMGQLQLQLVAGEGFKGGKGDSAKIILNETAVKEAGIKDPVGKWFSLWRTKAQIIGVVKDFHITSLKNKIEPTALYYDATPYMMYVKTTGKDAPSAIAAVEKHWKQYNAGFPLEYKFLDDIFDRMYKSDQRTHVLFNVFAGIAILISCLGLFGLATYTAQVKTREIGIRKVLGASILNVMTLLAKDFVKLVLIAIVIASPLAWLAMDKWLQNFEYRIHIGLWMFLLAGSLALLIALLTVSAQSIKAALANPVKSLKNNE